MATPSKKTTMFNYFTKLPSKTSIVDENPRKNATVYNKQHIEDFGTKLEQFDSEIFDRSEIVTNNYLTKINDGEHKPFKLTPKIKGSLRAKLLQFHEDVRPPYFGTWQKKSKHISGRSPFNLDNDLLDYDVDSEAEWDIGGPGESLKGDDSEDEDQAGDDYEIDMKTFVPHGYVSNDEMDENSDSEQNTSKNQLNDIANDSDSDIQIISDNRVQPKQQSPQPTQRKQTAKDLIPKVIGIKYNQNEDHQLKVYEGVPCT